MDSPQEKLNVVIALQNSMKERFELATQLHEEACKEAIAVDYKLQDSTKQKMAIIDEIIKSLIADGKRFDQMVNELAEEVKKIKSEGEEWMDYPNG